MPQNRDHKQESVHSPSPLPSTPALMSASANHNSPQPGPSILLNPYCRPSDGLRVSRSTSRFTQISGALKACFFNPSTADLPSPALENAETSTFHDQDTPPSSFGSNGKQGRKPDGQDSLVTRSPTTPVRSPVIKFAPLPQINNRIKRVNSIPIGVSSRALMLQCARESMMPPSTPKPGSNILSSSLPTRQKPEWPIECSSSSIPPNLQTSNPNPNSTSKPRRKRQGKKEREKKRKELELSGLEGMDVPRGRKSSSGSSGSDSASSHYESIFENYDERRGSVSSTGKTSVASILSDKADDSDVVSHEL